MENKCEVQGRSQEFTTGDKRGGLGDGSVPKRVQGQSPGGVSRRQMLISSYDWGICTYVPLATPLVIEVGASWGTFLKRREKWNFSLFQASS